jgi:two-component system, NarL family, nitrate/nitrite response regulator NarL
MKPLCTMSRRETQAALLLARGHSTKQVASVMGITYKTADKHRSNVYQKLGLHCTAELIHYALFQGWIPNMFEE